ncbi:MAG: hypothetical protein ACI4A3_01895 [Lachnospiraceae bacterium]
MRKNNLLFFVLLIGILLPVYGCSLVTTDSKSENNAEIEITLENTETEEKKEKADFSRGDLFTMFEEVNNETVLDFLYGDYNKDGIHEAFVLTGDSEYKLWYMSAENCEIIKEDFTESGEADIELLTFSTKDYLLLHRRENGIRNTLVYTIDNNNQVLEPNISGEGYFYQDTDGELILQIEKREAEKIFRCNYYLYYGFDEGFKEYGAIPIVEEQFLEFAGASDILDGISEKFSDSEVECSYLYRSNHYIDINILIKKDELQENRHMTLVYDTHKVKPVDENIMDGRVETAHMLEIATFPTAFKHPDKQIEE